MSHFEEQLEELLDRTKSIRRPINAAPLGVNIDEYNRPSEIWINDVEIFYTMYLKEHALGDRVHTLLGKRDLRTYSDLVACLMSVRNDKAFLDEVNKAM